MSKFSRWSIIVYFVTLTPWSGRAEELPELTRYLAYEIANSRRALAAPLPVVPGQEDYFLRRWYVRVQATFGIDVPWIALFQVIPEVELVWQRPLPEGWSEYSP